MSYTYQSSHMSNMDMNRMPQSHPHPPSLIPKGNSYFLDRRLVSIHSEDRDTAKWPESNHFEVELPESMKNVESIRLVNTSFPTNQYVFSHIYKNTRLLFTITMDSTDEAYSTWLTVSNEIITATIEEGFYTPQQLCNELVAKMNTAVQELMFASSGMLNPNYTYTQFSCYYHQVKHKILFGNKRDDFSLEFAVKPDYSDMATCKTYDVWNQTTRWSIGSYLGFDKIGYDAGAHTEGEALRIDYADEVWMTPADAGDSVYSVEPPDCINLFGENQMYMELDKYNQLDELLPYPVNTNAMYNARYGGRVDSAFAKIPLIQMPHAQIFDSVNTSLTGMSVFYQPLEQISKVKMTFRYHDGRRVDFRNMPFSFILEFNCLRTEPQPVHEVRKPSIVTR